MFELRDFQVVLEGPEGPCTGSGRVGEGGQLLTRRDAASGGGDLTEKGHSEQLAQLARGVDPGVERLTEERQCDS